MKINVLVTIEIKTDCIIYYIIINLMYLPNLLSRQTQPLSRIHYIYIYKHYVLRSHSFCLPPAAEPLCPLSNVPSHANNLPIFSEQSKKKLGHFAMQDKGDGGKDIGRYIDLNNKIRSISMIIIIIYFIIIHFILFILYYVLVVVNTCRCYSTVFIL